MICPIVLIVRKSFESCSLSEDQETTYATLWNFSGRQPLRWPPGIPAFGFKSLCNFLPFNVGRPTHSILMNRIQQKWWDATTKIRLHKHCGFHLGLPLLLSHCCSERSRLPCGELPYGRALEARNPVNYHASEPASRSSLSWAFRWHHSFGCHLDWSLVRDTIPETPR